MIINTNNDSEGLSDAAFDKIELEDDYNIKNQIF